MNKLSVVTNTDALIKIANGIAIGQPDSIFINTGSEADLEFVRKASIEKGEEKPLAMDGHTIHYDLPEEQGRIVDRTYYIINEGEPVSVLGNKMVRDEATAYVKQYMDGIMQGKTMYVGFFSRGPAGAKMAVTVNADGLRGPLPAPGQPTVLVLGDSFTFGESADRVENSFTGIFESCLDQDIYEVLNFGVSGFGTAQQLQMLNSSFFH